MRLAAFTAVILVSFTVGGCTNNSVSLESDAELELEIYKYLLSDLTDTNAIAVVESISSMGPITSENIRFSLSGQVDKNLVNDFINLNKEPQKIPLKLQSKNVVLLSHEDIRKLFEDGWSNFYKLYPKGIVVELSRPAFDKDRTHVLVHMGTHFDRGKGGFGTYYLLRKTAGKWQKYKQVRSFIA